eukprot:4309291-Alexandrium_andersonii.AAC.1
MCDSSTSPSLSLSLSLFFLGQRQTRTDKRARGIANVSSGLQWFAAVCIGLQRLAAACSSLHRFAKVCSGLQWFAARPLWGGYRTAGPPKKGKAPPARAGGAFWVSPGGGGRPGEEALQSAANVCNARCAVVGA